MKTSKKKWLYRALCAAMAVALVSGTAVMTPIADIVGTSIVANATENIVAQGSYWKLTDDDKDGNYKLTIFGTIPDTNGNSSKLPWYSYRNKITEVTTENGAKTSADASYLFSYLENATSMDLSHLDTSAATGMGRMFYNCKKLTSLNLSGWDTSNVTNMNNMFYSCEKLDSLDVSGFDTSNVTNMNNMFSNCLALSSLDLSGNWDTSSVTGMGSMFYHCENLTSLNLSGFNTSSVTNMSFMFGSCLKLTSLDLSGFDTSNVVFMNDMFKGSQTFTELDLSSFNTANVQQIQDMFQSCSNLKTITVGNGWNTGSVSYSAYMFKDCTALVGGKGTAYNADVVDVTYAKVDGGTSAPGYLTGNSIIAQGSYWKLTDEDFDNNYKLTIFGTIPDTKGSTANIPWYSYRNNITEVTTEDGAKTSADASYLFYYLTNATSIDLSHLDTSAATNMNSMLYYCSNLTSLDLSSWDTSNVTSMYNMFLGCSKLTTITVGKNWNTDKVTNSFYMFSNCSALVGGQGTTYNAEITNKTYARIDGGANAPGYLTDKTIIAQGDYWKVTDEDLDGNYKLVIFGTTPNTGGQAFKPPWKNYKDNITEVYAEKGAKTSADSGELFAYLRHATSMDLSNLDTSATTDMYCMFGYGDVLTSVNLSGWDTSKVTDMMFMFTDCHELTSINSSGWNCSSVQDMPFMFYNCYKLAELDTSSWKCSSVQDMSSMFYNCRKLTEVDLSSWNTSKTTNMNSVFCSCEELETIYVGGGWDTGAVKTSSNMFYGCKKLVGGNGTTFDSTKTDKTYARIDKDGQPGYLTGNPIIAQGDYWRITDEDFDNNYKLTIFGTIPDTNGSSENLPWYSYRDNITEVTTEDGAKTSADASFLFFYFTNATSIDLSHLDTSAATNMIFMLQDCQKLTSLNLSGFDTSKVTKMLGTFKSCNSLTLLDLSSWDTSNVTDMSDMFGRCSKLTTIIVGNGWNTDKVTESNDMFSTCKSLVGGRGTTYDSTKTDKTYAKADGGKENPGYFTESTCTVTWKNGDTILETDTDVERGTTPSYDGETPTKDSTAQYNYTFAGWTSDGGTTVYTAETLPALTGSVTYTAHFDAIPNECIVTWKNGDIILGTDTVAYGTPPVYNGQTPTKEATAQYTYTLSGWSDGENTYEPDALPAVTADVTYTAQFDAVRKPYFVDHKLSLDGGIGVYFYVNLTDEEAENAALSFSWADQSENDVSVEFDPVTEYYRAVCLLSASEMTSDITATLTVNGEEKETDICSLKEYAYQLINNPGCDETTSRLVKTMLNYGAASQAYFVVNTDKLANASLSEEDKAIADVTPAMIKANAPKYNLPKGVKLASATLSLQSETTLSIYLTSKKAVTDAQCGDYTVESGTSGSYKVLRIRGIKAEDLGKDLTVTFTISGKQYSVTYSPMYYCRSVLMNSSADENLKTAVKALYWYWQAAKEYADTALLAA